MLQSKIISLQVPVISESENVSSATAISDINALLAKSQAIYRYIAQKRMVGLPSDMGFEKVGEATKEIALPDGTVLKMYPESYASFLLFPLLTSLVNGRIVMLGDPGLGKTQIATLMGQMLGLPLPAIRAGMVNGHPQLTMADLFGNLDLAEYAKGKIRPVWRDIVQSRFRFLNEFNRIPTKTQSGLLGALAEQYVELFNQAFEMEDAPWYFTANEANGGGTYQVIAALWDRIEVSVRATPVNAHHLEKARGIDNRTGFSEHLRLSEEEIKGINQKIESLPVDKNAEERLTYFFSQLNACEKAAEDVEHRFKSHIVEGGKRGDALWSGAHDDPAEYIGAQVENTVGTRIYFSTIRYAKALAWFRGKEKVETEDIRAILPAVMSHRIKPNRSAQAEDRWAWVGKLWQKAMDRYDERERDADKLSYTRLLEELEGKPLEEKPIRIEQYMEKYAQVMDGSAGIEELLAMKMVYESVMGEVRKAGITPTLPAIPEPSPPPSPPTSDTPKSEEDTEEEATEIVKGALTPESILRISQTGKRPPIGSFIQLPGGLVEIGNTFEGEGEAHEKPVHRVKISPFLISPYTVTNAEFGKFIEEGGYTTDKFWSQEGWIWRKGNMCDDGMHGYYCENVILNPELWKDPGFNQPNQPVVGVSYYEAEAFLMWMSEKAGEEYRLPTEHEWEYAARAGLVGKRYPWGDENPTGRAHFGKDPLTGAPIEVNVKGYPPNGFGLYHMAGNVLEWVSDWYADNYYQTLANMEKVKLNPKGPNVGFNRVCRGGSWNCSIDKLRVVDRISFPHVTRNDNLGFRVVRTP